MGKEVIVDVKITTKQAQENIDELNKSLMAQEDLIENLESDLRGFEKQLSQTSGKELARRSDLNKKITETKNRLNEEKAGLKQINKERKRANDQLKDASKNTKDYSGVIGILDRQTGGLISSTKDFTGSLSSATKGTKLLRVALLAVPFVLIATAIASISAALTSSEEGQDKFTKFFTQVKVVIGNVTDLFADFGSALLKFFSGDLKGAREEFDKLREGIANFGEETKKEIELAGKLSDKRAKANKLERQLLIDRAKADRKFNELREKAADKENVSINERIAALKEAGRIEEEITLKEIEAAKLRLEAKETENSLSKSTQQDLDEEAQLRAKVIELESSRLKKQKTLTAEITTNLREQKAEEKRLEDEANAAKDEADAAQLEKEKQLAELKKQIRDAEASSEDDRRALELIKIDEQFQALIDKAKENNLATQELEDAQRQAKIDKQKHFDEIDEKREKEHQDKISSIKNIEIETEQKIQQAKLSLASQTGNLLTQLAGKNKTAAIAGVLIQKAAAVGQIISNTGIANAKAVAASPITLGQPFVTINSISAGLSIASSLAETQKAIQQIRSAGPGASSGTGSAGGGSVNIPTPQAPAFNIVGSDTQNQLAQTIAEQTQKPVKAFVVAGDVSTAQSLDRNIIQESSLG
tara:strand:- start:1548 stop:3485 length:1938 start_codon:yes stop_codon:yes gene_type:complete